MTFPRKSMSEVKPVRVSQLRVRECPYKECQKDPNGKIAEHHRNLNFMMHVLNERDRRLVAGSHAELLGDAGNKLVAEITGMDVKVIQKGREELATPMVLKTVRKPGGGRTSKKKTLVVQVLEDLLADETTGDPMTRTKCVRRTLRWIQEELCKKDIRAVLSTICAYLRCLGYSLKSNVKILSTKTHPLYRNQFEYLLETKKRFLDAKQPVISVDTKKKENVSIYKNSGQTWRLQALSTFDHDFPSLRYARLVPYGIYDEKHNSGFMYVELSAETSTFAVDRIVAWWESEGKSLYQGATSLLILCDGGGANGSRRRLWKWELQNQLADRLGLIVTVCHYPPGTSKWNPIEHRFFSFISLNWAGESLTSVELPLNYMRTTHTTKGLRVTAVLTEKIYPKCVEVTKEQIDSIQLDRHEILSQWNYTIHPRSS